MEQTPRRKFKADITKRSIDAVLSKRQRKRSCRPRIGSDAEDDHSDATIKLYESIRNASDRPVEIQCIPNEMLPKYKKYQRDRGAHREFEKPENWIMPKKEVQRSREEVFATERTNIKKTIDISASWSRAARMLLVAKQQHLTRPSSSLTAKGYISNRVENELKGNRTAQ